MNNSIQKRQFLKLQQKKQEQPTNNWLRDNGIVPKHFNSTPIPILKAQQIAHNLLKHHGTLLDEQQARYLNNFQKKLKSADDRKHITIEHAKRVMNIGAKINRQLFKLNRQSTGNW